MQKSFRQVVLESQNKTYSVEFIKLSIRRHLSREEKERKG